MLQSLRPGVLAFLVVCGITGLIWTLRGLKILTFFPGGVLWVLILLCLLAALLSLQPFSR